MQGAVQQCTFSCLAFGFPCVRRRRHTCGRQKDELHQKTKHIPVKLKAVSLWLGPSKELLELLAGPHMSVIIM